MRGGFVQWTQPRVPASPGTTLHPVRRARSTLAAPSLRARSTLDAHHSRKLAHESPGMAGRRETDCHGRQREHCQQRERAKTRSQSSHDGFKSSDPSEVRAVSSQGPGRRLKTAARDAWMFMPNMSDTVEC